MTDYMQEIEAIQSEAKARGVYIQHVLDGAGVARSTWMRWRKQEREPKFSTLRKVRQSLDRISAVPFQR